MKGINKVILVGNVGNDPETRSVNETLFANLTLATSEQWKDKNTGERKEATEWHKVSFRARLAEVVSQYVVKGMMLYVEGSLRTRSWEQDGMKRYATEIVASEMQILSPKNGTTEPAGSRRGAAPAAPESPSRAGGRGAGAPTSSRRGPPPDDYDDDIPF